MRWWPRFYCATLYFPLQRHQILANILDVASCGVTKKFYSVTLSNQEDINSDADSNHASIAIIRLRDSVCLSVHTIEPKRLKLKRKSQTWHRDSPSRYLAHQLILGQKVKDIR